jgi:hypothetical protein
MTWTAKLVCTALRRRQDLLYRSLEAVLRACCWRRVAPTGLAAYKTKATPDTPP